VRFSELKKDVELEILAKGGPGAHDIKKFTPTLGIPYLGV